MPLPTTQDEHVSYADRQSTPAEGHQARAAIDDNDFPKLVPVAWVGWMISSPNYRKGEHVVAFLRRMPDTTRYTTNANSQGKFNVVRDRIGPDQTPLKGFIERVARELTDGSVR